MRSRDKELGKMWKEMNIVNLKTYIYYIRGIERIRNKSFKILGIPA
jgi:hypothetical protein